MVMWSRDNSVSKTIGYELDDRVSIPDRDRDFSLLHCVHTGSGATQPPIQWTPLWYERVKLVTHLRVVPSLRIGGSLPPLLHTFSWRSA